MVRAVGDTIVADPEAWPSRPTGLSQAGGGASFDTTGQADDLVALTGDGGRVQLDTADSVLPPAGSGPSAEWTKAELAAYAREAGIQIGGRSTKAQIVEALGL